MYNGGTFIMHGGTILGGSAKAGGGVYNGGAFTMDGGAITGNSASTGGGVYNGGTFTVTGGAISDNTAAIFGGGVTNMGTLKLSGTASITGNTCSNGDGGGVSSNGKMTLSETGTISGNTCSGYGGGVFNNQGIFTMTGGAISDNTAAIFGGGVIIYSDSTFAMTGGAISGNNAGETGGGVFVIGTLALSGSPVITGNTVQGDTGNVYLFDGVITLTEALDSGASVGVSMQTPGTFTSGWKTYMDGKTPSGIFASDSGDFMVVTDIDGEVTLASSADAAASVTSGGTVTYFATLGEALARWADGGKLTLLADATTESTVTAPTGAVELDLNGFGVTYTGSKNASVITVPVGAALTLSDSGDATHYYYIDDNGLAHVVESTDANYTGAADNKKGSFTGGYITGGKGTNPYQSFLYGGGVYIKDDGTNGGSFTMNGGTIIGNTAQYGGGVYSSGSVYTDDETQDIRGGAFTMNGGTITGNTATNSGGGAFISGGLFTMTGGEISGNTAGSGKSDVYAAKYTRAEISGSPKIGSMCLTYTDLTVTGPLTDDAKIGVVTTDPLARVFTKGLRGNGVADNFFSEDETYCVKLTADGEAVLSMAGDGVVSVTTDGVTTEYVSLVEAFKYTQDGSVVKLLGNVTLEDEAWVYNEEAAEDDGSINTYVTLDLNGFGVDLNGYEIIISYGASLTLTDGNPTAAHTYTVDENGLAHVVLPTEDDATQDGEGETKAFTGGYITGGSAEKYGGSVYVTGGAFTMEAGTIIGNKAGKGLGVVYVSNNGLVHHERRRDHRQHRPI